MGNDPVVVLLSTYNGANYLESQLNSILAQTHSNTSILVRDDGSSDTTLLILKQYEMKYDCVQLMPQEDNKGPKLSFGRLLQEGLSGTKANYFMFADQDDVWLPDKIEKSLARMKQLEETCGQGPLLIHTDLKVVDERQRELNPSFWNYQKLNPAKDAFPRLLMQNVITGCTMMINRRLAELSLPVHRDAIMHDWWIGLVASAFGRIGHVPEPTMLYRQHGENSVGAKRFGTAYIKNKLLEPVYLDKNIRQARAFEEQFSEALPEESRQYLREFIKLERSSFLRGRASLLKNGFLKIGIVRNLGLFLNWKS
ncbi:glycosyltransferase family 2 protein [Paenibacillus sp. UNC499MF]|uniref:glycosyltransferase family 2 protein n=1 Tax=Paenibacillus sp. UNC499MF TaxID=1502751 RepID=UPI00089FF198|nr:glycosyltransferase family 2 protein [Paenibacillus sp. UNC499MF]SEG70611.1 Glycosyl transferase family 2 [Paenibacillus sp. UNC499MF]